MIDCPYTDMNTLLVPLVYNPLLDRAVKDTDGDVTVPFGNVIPLEVDSGTSNCTTDVDKSAIAVPSTLATMFPVAVADHPVPVFPAKL
jgi:hypothetical protein